MVKPIKIIQFGIAWSDSNFIYINENILKHEKLFTFLVKHENEHTNKFWSWKDFKVDFFSKPNLEFSKLYWGFGLKHPKLIIQQHLPIWITKVDGKREINYNINMILFWGVITIYLLCLVWVYLLLT